MKTLKLIVVMALIAGWNVSAQGANPVLCAEIATDPLGRGYAGMTPEQIAADMVAAYRVVYRETVHGADLFEGIEVADWVARSEAEKTQIIALLSFGQINPQGKVRTLLISIFGGGSQTLANMADISRQTITRTAELGLGNVRTGDVQECF